MGVIRMDHIAVVHSTEVSFIKAQEQMIFYTDEKRNDQ
jgi:hypothetical protein